MIWQALLTLLCVKELGKAAVDAAENDAKSGPKLPTPLRLLDSLTFDTAISSLGTPFRMKVVYFYAGYMLQEDVAALIECRGLTDNPSSHILYYRVDCNLSPSVCENQNVRFGGGRWTSMIMMYSGDAPAEVYRGKPKLDASFCKALASVRLRWSRNVTFLTEDLEFEKYRRRRPFVAFFVSGDPNGQESTTTIYELASQTEFASNLDFVVASYHSGARQRFSLKDPVGAEPSLVLTVGGLEKYYLYNPDAQANINLRRGKGSWDLEVLKAWLLGIMYREVKASRSNPVRGLPFDLEFPPMDVARELKLLATAEAAAATLKAGASVEHVSKEQGIAVAKTGGKQTFVPVIVKDSVRNAQVKLKVPADSNFQALKRALVSTLRDNAVLTAKLSLPDADGEAGPVVDDADPLGNVREVIITDFTLPAYQRLAYGVAACPEGLEIRSADECQRALTVLGLTIKPAWISSYDGLPSWCSVREKSSKVGKERMHFNSHRGGVGRVDLAPVCIMDPTQLVKARKPTPTPTSQPPVPQVLELVEENSRELFGVDGYTFIYLTAGGITDSEIGLIKTLQDTFQSSLDRQGTRMSWAWLDGHKERRWKDIFDPPTLPSAVVLNAHKARFVRIRHPGEEEEEPRPANEESLQLLLNTVLGGDARFVKVKPKLASLWISKRRKDAESSEVDGGTVDATEPVEENREVDV